MEKKDFGVREREVREVKETGEGRREKERGLKRKGRRKKRKEIGNGREEKRREMGVKGKVWTEKK